MTQKPYQRSKIPRIGANPPMQPARIAKAVWKKTFPPTAPNGAAGTLEDTHHEECRNGSAEPLNLNAQHARELLATAELKEHARAYKDLSQKLLRIRNMRDDEALAALKKYTKREMEMLQKGLQELGDPWNPMNLFNLWGYRNLRPAETEPDAPTLVLRDQDLTELVAYARETMTEGQVRMLLGFIADRQKDLNISYMAKTLHVGENRLRKGMEEFKNAGGLVYAEGNREPNGGRPSQIEAFRAYITPECIASGITAEELADIRKKAEAGKESGVRHLDDSQIEKYLQRIQELSLSVEDLAQKCESYAFHHGTEACVGIAACATFLNNVFQAIVDIPKTCLVPADQESTLNRLDKIRVEIAAEIFICLSNGVQTMLDTWDEGLSPDTVQNRLEETFWTPEKRDKVEKLVISCHFFALDETPEHLDAQEKSSPVTGKKPSESKREEAGVARRQAPGVVPPTTEERVKAAKEAMGSLMETLLAGKASETRGNKLTIEEAIQFLENLQEDFIQGAAMSPSPGREEEADVALAFWAEKLRVNVEGFLEGPETTAFSKANRAAERLLKPSFQCLIEDARDEFLMAVTPSEKEGCKSTLPKDIEIDPDEAEGTPDSSPSDAERIREECIKEFGNLEVCMEKLVTELHEGLNSGSRGDMDRIRKGLDILETLRSRYRKTFDEGLACGKPKTWKALFFMDKELLLIVLKCQAKWDGKSGTSFAKAINATSVLLSPRKFPGIVEKIWKKYDYDKAEADVSKYRNLPLCDVSSVDLDDKADWFIPHSQPLPPIGRSAIIRELCKDGKDPTDIFAWLEYIVFSEHCRTVTDPSSMRIYSFVRSRQLKYAFEYLTGFDCAHTTLWGLLTKGMNVRLRQPIETRPTEDHPLREIQYRITRARQLLAGPETEFCQSIDTKAQIQLGWMKHGNGHLLARCMDGSCTFLDHTFPQRMRDIYPNGTDLVDPSRLDEFAVLKPVGSYDPKDKIGHISFILGQDTAESMCDHLWRVIHAKKEVRKKLERVIIFADCGGANLANGVLWLDALADLSAATNLTLEVRHLAPGSSKLNSIEHSLWSYLSIKCMGRPYSDIETMLRYANEASAPDSRQMFAIFISKKYLTIDEKKLQGLPVPIRADIDLKLNRRIVYYYSEETSLRKMNYCIFPTPQDEETLKLEATLGTLPGIEEEAKRIMARHNKEESAQLGRNPSDH